MPRIQMTRSTQFALLFLRLYLLAMLALILFKFIKILGSAPPHP